jgi:hypothetical protein
MHIAFISLSQLIDNVREALYGGGCDNWGNNSDGTIAPFLKGGFFCLLAID